MTIFGAAHSVSYLQVQLSSIQQFKNESVKDFSNCQEKNSA